MTICFFFFTFLFLSFSLYLCFCFFRFFFLSFSVYLPKQFSSLLLSSVRGSRIYWVDEPSSLTLQGGSRWAILLTVVVKRPVVETETLPPPCHSPLLNPPCNSSLLNLQNLVISYFESPESPKSLTDTLKGLPNSSIPPQYKKSPKQLNAAKKSLLLTQLLMNIWWQHWYSLNLPNIILSLALVISHSKNNSLKKKNVAVTIPSSCIWPYETFLGSPSS